MLEEWRDITGYEGIYQVSNLGQIKSLSRIVCAGRKGNSCVIKQELFVKFSLSEGHRTQYYVFNLKKDGKAKKVFVHKLVAQAFLPNPLNHPIVNHKDLNKLNNCVSNLEWCSYSENNHHYHNMRKKIIQDNATF